MNTVAQVGAALPEIKAQVPGAPTLCGCKTDLEQWVPISLIRTHTKTDDVPHVTDEQLALYRQAAFEAAEKYTGWLFTEIKVITESIAAKPGRRWRPTYRHKLRYASADGRVYLYGARDGFGSAVLEIEPGERFIEVPIQHHAVDVSFSCCNPCSDGRGVNYGMRVTYRAGIDCKFGGVPASIIAGVLKFIAWSVQNPGDVIMTVRNRESGESTGIIGTNNPAWASGAIEQWRIIVDDAI